MTIPSTPRKAGPLSGNGVNTSFPFTFKVFAEGDIAVTVANSVGVETDLVLNTGYTVALNANQDTSPGGTVTYPISGAPMPVGSVLTVVGNLDYDQPLDIPTGGNFRPESLENQLDRMVMQVQQLEERQGRAITVPVTEPAPDPFAMPSVEIRKGKVLGFDASGAPTVLAAGSGTQYGIATYEYTAAAGQTNFLTGASYEVGYVRVFVNGFRLTSADFVATDGSTVSLVTPATTGAKVTIECWGTFVLASLNSVASSLANVNAVAGSIANVNAVAGDLPNIDTVGAAISNVNAVGSNIANVNAVAGDRPNIDTVGAAISNVNAVAGSIANVNAVAGDLPNIDTVGAAISNVNAVGSNIANVNAVAGDLPNIDTVGAAISNVNAVAGSIANVNTAATNIAAIIAAPGAASAAAASAAAAQDSKDAAAAYAASINPAAFATAAQGAKADAALQPAAIGSTVQAYDAQTAKYNAATPNFTGDLQVGGFSVGTKIVPQNSQSAAYTCVLTDSGKHLLHPSADTTACTFTIPANSSVPYPIGTAITFVNQNGAGTVTIAITSDTMRLAGAGTTGNRTLAANGIATALKITSTEWIISGSGLT